MTPSGPPKRDRRGRDSDVVRRAAITNLVGHLGMAFGPALLVLVTRSFSTRAYGLYVFGYAAIQVLSKVALQGFQHGYPYWIPRAKLTGRSPGIVAGGLRVTAFALVLAAVAIVAAPAFALARGLPGAALGWQWMLVGLPALALAELLVHVTLACGTLSVQVWARDVVRPVAIFGSALGFFALGYAEQGLAWGFVLGLYLDLVVIALATRAVLRRNGITLSPSLRIPRPLQRYATPAWASGLVGELWFRLDTLVLALFVSPATLGIYGIAKEFGSVVRSVGNGAFPVLTALFSDAAHRAHGRRVTTTYTYATTIAVLMQLPLLVVFVVFGRQLLALFGAEYVAGYQTVILLAVGWLAFSLLGSAARIVEGFGRSGLVLASTVLGVCAEALFLALLCPRFGMEGAAVAAGLSSIVAASVHFYFAYRLNDRLLPFTGAIVEPLVIAALSLLVSAAAYYALRGIEPAWLRGAGTLIAFALPYGALLIRSSRSNSPAFSAPAR